MVLDGRAIGTAGGDALPEIGFILHPDHWGKGLAVEAMAAVIAHIFATQPVAALTADVDPRNAASLRLLERLGFVVSGRAQRTFLLGDEWCDSVYLRLDRPRAACGSGGVALPRVPAATKTAGADRFEGTGGQSSR